MIVLRDPQQLTQVAQSEIKAFLRLHRYTHEQKQSK